MSLEQEEKEWFFREDAPENERGQKVNLSNEGEPDQDLWERLVTSIPFFRKEEDRAKQSTGVESFNELAGLTSVATDEEVKAYTSGLDPETTKVPHPQQLPEVNSDNQTTTPLDGVSGDDNLDPVDIETITVTVDPTQPLRNNFLLRVSGAFQSYINSIIDNLGWVNTFTFGTGGRGEPGQDGTGLSGFVYGTDGTPGAPGADGLTTIIYGPGGSGSDPNCPGLLCTVYGEDGLPGAPGTDGLVTTVESFAEGGTLLVEDEGSEISGILPEPETIKTMDFVGEHVEIQPYVPGSNKAVVDFTATDNEITNINNNLQNAMPVGAVIDWIAPLAPTDWLLCNGDPVSRTTYASLFAVMGVSFGAGDGSTTFNLPDLREKFVAGMGSGAEFNNIGDVYGSHSETLNSSQIPEKAHGHANTLAGIIDLSGVSASSLGSEHQHKLAMPTSPSAGDDVWDMDPSFEFANVKGWNGISYAHTGTKNALSGGTSSGGVGGNGSDQIAQPLNPAHWDHDGGHSHPLTGNASVTGSVTDAGNVENATSHNNKPRYVVMNKIIKAL